MKTPTHGPLLTRSAVLTLVLAATLISPAAAQDTLRLPALQDAAVQQDPRTRQLALEESATELRLRNIGVDRLPELTLTAEAVRLSEVTEIPVDIPGARIATPPKQRYEVALEAGLLLYDGGVLGARRNAERARLAATRAELAAELYPLRMEVVSAYFGALLAQERLREMSTLIEDLEARLSEVRSHYEAGAALPGDTATVRAELLRAMQQRDEVAADRRASLSVLEKLTGKTIAEADVLSIPDFEVSPGRPTATRGHPRFRVFAAQRASLDRQAALIRARRAPQLSAFGEYSYGRPGLRQFTTDFHDYWLGGLRFRWSPWNWGRTDREVDIVRLQNQVIDAEEAAFAEQLTRLMQQPLEAMRRLRIALETDQQIVVLREQAERQARTQFAERAITAAAYVDARTDLQDARIALVRHRAELARAQAEYLTTLGVELQ